MDGTTDDRLVVQELGSIDGKHVLRTTRRTKDGTSVLAFIVLKDAAGEGGRIDDWSATWSYVVRHNTQDKSGGWRV